MYAIIATGGKQYKVSEGDIITIEKLGHSYDMEIMKYMETENIDAIIPGEIIEWTILSYIRDAAYMGKHKACFNIGHFNMEELGMKYAADWIGELLNNEIPVNYIPTEDGWTFL